jgi:hypothetical protein
MPLGNCKLLGRSGLRVSPMSLGTMTCGSERGWGADIAEARRIFDLYVDRAGNFIDTTVPASLLRPRTISALWTWCYRRSSLIG